MAVKSNESRGRTGSLSGRARSLLLYPSGPDPRDLTWTPGPRTLHRLVRWILFSEQSNFGILRGRSRIGAIQATRYREVSTKLILIL